MVKRTLGVVGHRGGGEDEAGTVVVHAEAEHQRGPLRLVGAGETAYPATEAKALVQRTAVTPKTRAR